MHTILARTRIVLTLVALLVILFVGRFMVAQAPTAYASYTPPPGSCSSWSLWQKDHWTSYPINGLTYNFTEWVEIDGLYSGSTFCGVARVSICRYGNYFWDGSLSAYYTLSGGGGGQFSGEPFLAIKAGQTVCDSRWSSITMYAGESITVTPTWAEYNIQAETPPWTAGRGF